MNRDPNNKDSLILRNEGQQQQNNDSGGNMPGFIS